jgi:hypothetical protein
MAEALKLPPSPRFYHGSRARSWRTSASSWRAAVGHSSPATIGQLLGLRGRRSIQFGMNYAKTRDARLALLQGVDSSFPSREGRYWRRESVHGS